MPPKVHLLTLYSSARNQLGSLRKRLARPGPIVRHDDFDGRREVVVLLQGFSHARNVWDVMEDRLRYDGFSVLSFNHSWRLLPTSARPLETAAEQVADKLHRLRARFELDGFHIVGHSRGGLIGRRLIESYGAGCCAKSLITLGTAHRGTMSAVVGNMLRGVADDAFPDHVPLTSITSSSDWLTPSWQSTVTPITSSHPMVNVRVQGVGHTELLWSPVVYREVRAALLDAAELWSKRGDAERR